MKKAYIKLEEEDFKALTRGEEVILRDQIRNINVHLILADIGYENMLDIIQQHYIKMMNKNKWGK